ncbi:hypothetical protein BDV97DRAFT_354907 [Delphinella strobiligena]|nr:hypothetical protein BDV97DRAFT_354907 [Delphinella strobiligena]
MYVEDASLPYNQRLETSTLQYKMPIYPSTICPFLVYCAIDPRLKYGRFSNSHESTMALSSIISFIENSHLDSPTKKRISQQATRQNHRKYCRVDKSPHGLHASIYTTDRRHVVSRYSFNTLTAMTAHNTIGPYVRNIFLASSRDRKLKRHIVCAGQKHAGGLATNAVPILIST